jgi:pyrroline-5-carboxylate reductase
MSKSGFKKDSKKILKKKVFELSETKNYKFFFLGCGKMGSAIARNLIKENSIKANQITVLKKSDKNKITGLSYIKNISCLPQNYQADVVFIAVKPQNAQIILSDFSNHNIFHKNTVFISVLAGKKIEFFEKIFGKKAKIIRSMPNLPILHSQGIFLYLCNKKIKTGELQHLIPIFEKFGLAFKLKDENLFDAATAIFGCGPAYIFLLQEILSEAAIKSGIKKSDSQRLVKKLFLGTALMSDFSKKNDFSKLLNSVISKNGTTAAALQILQKNSALKNIFTEAIKAAVNKSKEIANTKI